MYQPQVATQAHNHQQHDRRQPVIPMDLWDDLSSAQQVVIYHLRQYGYELLFIRNSQQGLAIARCAGQLLTVDRNGTVDSNPKIQLRLSS